MLGMGLQANNMRFHHGASQENPNARTVKSLTRTLSTRAKRGLRANGIHTVEQLEATIDEHGERYIRERLFQIGPVTAAEILGSLYDGSLW